MSFTFLAERHGRRGVRVSGNRGCSQGDRIFEERVVTSEEWLSVTSNTPMVPLRCQWHNQRRQSSMMRRKCGRRIGDCSPAGAFVSWRLRTGRIPRRLGLTAAGFPAMNATRAAPAKAAATR